MKYKKTDIQYLILVINAFIGCEMLFNTSDQANITSINREIEKDKALSQFDKGLEFYDQKNMSRPVNISMNR